VSIDVLGRSGGLGVSSTQLSSSEACWPLGLTKTVDRALGRVVGYSGMPDDLCLQTEGCMHCDVVGVSQHILTLRTTRQWSTALGDLPDRRVEAEAEPVPRWRATCEEIYPPPSLTAVGTGSVTAVDASGTE